MCLGAYPKEIQFLFQVQVSFTGKRRKRSLNGEPDEDEAEWNPEIKEKMHEMEVRFSFG